MIEPKPCPHNPAQRPSNALPCPYPSCHGSEEGNLVVVPYPPPMRGFRTYTRMDCGSMGWEWW